MIAGQINGSAELEARARQELNARGLDEDQVRARLEERGIDVYSIDTNNPVEMLKAQKALEDVLAELESEKLVANVGQRQIVSDTLKEKDKKIIAKKSEEVSEAVEDGSSLEEAVSETLTEDQTRKLPKSNIYGQEVFRSQSIKLYRQSKDVKPPNSYVLGVGDIIALSIWGASEESQIFEINADGYIKPAGMSRIYLKGINYLEAKDLLRKKFQGFYNFKDNQFEISLNFSRTINVSVVGEVFNFGSFNIPAINTAFNALVAAGGPNNIGSVRKIQLMRAGQQPQTIDIYKYLINPAVGNDFYLQENDIINVPVAEKLVTISGAIKRPFTYELLSNENLSKLIEYARGLKPNARKKNIQIIRYQNDEEIIIDVNWTDLQSKRMDYTLLPGDRVIVDAISSAYDNFVSISGAVENGGKFSYSEGDRITDLLDRLEIVDGALLGLSYLKRLNEDQKTISYVKVNIEEALKNPNSDSNIILQKGDNLVIMKKGAFVDESTVAIRGSVRNETSFKYDYSQSLRVSDALFMAGGLRLDATDFAFVRRVDPTNPKESQYIKVDLAAIEKDVNSSENIYLQAKDVITVNSKQDFTDAHFVSVEGFVRNPGKFIYNKSLSIEDVLTMSGGLRYEAYRNNIDIYRVDINDDNNTKTVAASVKVDENLKVIGNDFALKPFDEIVVRKAPEFELQKIVQVTGDVMFPGRYALIKDNERISDVLKRVGGFTDEASLENITLKRANKEGFILADFTKALKNPGSTNDIILMPGDLISVPKIQNLVTISGFTTANTTYAGDAGKISVPFEKGKNAKYYINKYAAGVAINGDKNKITVVEQNGKVTKLKKFLFFKDYPDVGRGAIINVGPKVVKQKSVNGGKKVDWNSVFASSVAQATSILTLVLLLQRLD